MTAPTATIHAIPKHRILSRTKKNYNPLYVQPTHTLHRDNRHCILHKNNSHGETNHLVSAPTHSWHCASRTCHSSHIPTLVPCNTHGTNNTEKLCVWNITKHYAGASTSLQPRAPNNRTKREERGKTDTTSRVILKSQ